MIRNQLSAFLHRTHIGKRFIDRGIGFWHACNARTAQTFLYNNVLRMAREPLPVVWSNLCMSEPRQPITAPISRPPPKH